MWSVEWAQNNESFWDLSQKLKQNLNPELQKILEDKMLNSQEAKALRDVFRANQEMVFQVTRENLADLRKSLNTESNLNILTVEDEQAINKIADETENPVQQSVQSEQIVQKVDKQNQNVETNKELKFESVLWWRADEFESWVTEQNAEKEFRQKYGKFTEQLSNSLWLPNGMINAIVHKETDFWVWRIDKHWERVLYSQSGSKWMMQLTKWPFKDMAWDTNRKNNTDIDKIENYRDIFKKLNLSEIKSLDMWEGKTLESTLSSDLWTKLEKIQNPATSSEESRDIFQEFGELIKNNESDWKYLHTLNMIIWSVYLSNIYDHTSGSEERRIKKSAQKYNWEPGNRKVRYAKHVYQLYLNEQKA